MRQIGSCREGTAATTARDGLRVARGLKALLATVGIVGLWGSATGFHEAPQDDPRGLHPTFRLDGKFVHNVGRLHLQLTNIGETGNQSNPARTTVPSAEYPPGSGFDHLYAAGLWVGAID